MKFNFSINKMRELVLKYPFLKTFDKEISRKLSAMCKKDSDFQPLGERETLDKRDFIAFVKDNKNRSMTLGQLYSFIIKNQNIDISAILSKLNTIVGFDKFFENLLEKNKTTEYFFSTDKAIEYGIIDKIGFPKIEYNVTVTTNIIG